MDMEASTPEHRRQAALERMRKNLRLVDVPESTRSRYVIAMCLLMSATVLPALASAGFDFPKRPLLQPLTWLSWDAWMGISATIGAFSGAIFYPEMRFWYLGVIPGSCSGPTVLLLSHVYSQARAEIYPVEMILMFLAGVIPWILAYTFALRWAVLREADRAED